MNEHTKKSIAPIVAICTFGVFLMVGFWQFGGEREKIEYTDTLFGYGPERYYIVLPGTTSFDLKSDQYFEIYVKSQDETTSNRFLSASPMPGRYYVTVDSALLKPGTKIYITEGRVTELNVQNTYESVLGSNVRSKPAFNVYFFASLFGVLLFSVAGALGAYIVTELIVRIGDGLIKLLRKRVRAAKT